MSAKQRKVKGAVYSMIVGVGLLFGAQVRGDEPQFEVYNGLANTPGSADFWDTTGYTGTSNPVGSASLDVFSLGAGGATGALAGTLDGIFTPFSFYFLCSPAGPLNSREPSGLSIFIR